MSAIRTTINVLGTYALTYSWPSHAEDPEHHDLRDEHGAELTLEDVGAREGLSVDRVELAFAHAISAAEDDFALARFEARQSDLDRDTVGAS